MLALSSEFTQGLSLPHISAGSLYCQQTELDLCRTKSCSCLIKTISFVKKQQHNCPHLNEMGSSPWVEVYCLVTDYTSTWPNHCKSCILDFFWLNFTLYGRDGGFISLAILLVFLFFRVIYLNILEQQHFPWWEACVFCLFLGYPWKWTVNHLDFTAI